jgi:VCBS repeat-containing protein
METLKEIVNTLKIIGISMAGITFVVFMIKIATEPDMKSKYLKLTKHLLMATILITVSLSLVEIPKHYYGDVVSIVDNKETQATIAELKDKDCQGRETINIDGKWYVVTDTGMKLGALTEGDSLDNVTTMGLYDTTKVVENVSFLRLFSESQGTFKGYFADVIYYRDQDGLIFPRDYTYSQYQSLKASQGDGGVMNNTGGNRRR